MTQRRASSGHREWETWCLLGESVAVLTWEETWLPVSPWRQGRAVLFVSWIPGASLVFGRLLLVVLQVGPLFVLGTLALQVLVLFGGRCRSLRSLLRLEFLALSQEASVNVCRARTKHGAGIEVKCVLVHGACVVSYSRCCASFSSWCLVRLLVFQMCYTIFGRCLWCDAQYNAGIAACRIEDARLLTWTSLLLSCCCAVMGVRWLRQDCVSYRRIATAGLRTVYFLVESGALFTLVRHVASGTLFRSLPTRKCRRRAYFSSETSVFALSLRGASPFCSAAF